MGIQQSQDNLISKQKLTFIESQHFEGGSIVYIFKIGNNEKYTMSTPLYYQYNLSEIDKQVIEKRVKVQHPHIMQALGIDKAHAKSENDSSMFFFEYSYITLEELIQERVGSNKLFPEEDLMALLKGVTSALLFLWNRQITNGNINPRTILFDQENGAFKIYDRELLCGKASAYQQVIKNQKFHCLSPEAIISMRQGDKTLSDQTIISNDIFCLGLILLETASLQQSKECYDSNYSILAQEVQNRMDFIKKYYSTYFVECLELMLCYNVNERPKIKQLWEILNNQSSVSQVKLENSKLQNFQQIQNYTQIKQQNQQQNQLVPQSQKVQKLQAECENIYPSSDQVMTEASLSRQTFNPQQNFKVQQQQQKKQQPVPALQKPQQPAQNTPSPTKSPKFQSNQQFSFPTNSPKQQIQQQQVPQQINTQLLQQQQIEQAPVPIQQYQLPQQQQLQTHIQQNQQQIILQPSQYQQVQNENIQLDLQHQLISNQQQPQQQLQQIQQPPQQQQNIVQIQQQQQQQQYPVCQILQPQQSDQQQQRQQQPYIHQNVFRPSEQVLIGPQQYKIIPGLQQQQPQQNQQQFIQGSQPQHQQFINQTIAPQQAQYYIQQQPQYQAQPIYLEDQQYPKQQQILQQEIQQQVISNKESDIQQQGTQQPQIIDISPNKKNIQGQDDIKQKHTFNENQTSFISNIQQIKEEIQKSKQKIEQYQQSGLSCDAKQIQPDQISANDYQKQPQYQQQQLLELQNQFQNEKVMDNQQIIVQESNDKENQYKENQQQGKVNHEELEKRVQQIIHRSQASRLNQN